MKTFHLVFANHDAPDETREFDIDAPDARWAMHYAHDDLTAEEGNHAWSVVSITESEDPGDVGVVDSDPLDTESAPDIEPVDPGVPA